MKFRTRFLKQEMCIFFPVLLLPVSRRGHILSARFLSSFKLYLNVYKYFNRFAYLSLAWEQRSLAGAGYVFELHKL